MSTLMISISGIRGIIGDGLDPQVLVRFASAYADFIGEGKVVIGTDGRISGEMVKSITAGTLSAKGLDIIDIGIVPTPTVQYTVKKIKAAGGIAVSASHNPNEWNALKLLNSTGQFMSKEENFILLKKLNDGTNVYNRWNELGNISRYPDAVDEHINDVMNLGFVNVDAVRKRKFKVVADCVNGAGVYCIPKLLEKFGCEVIKMNCESSGIFPRMPEPLPENLAETMKRVKDEKADLGIVVDPDVDRLVLITGEGEPFGEENTITQAIKFILSRQQGNAVVNLSTTRGAEDVAAEAGCTTYRSAVGEANVVAKMKEVNAVIGGEGSGGVILPELHYGRDALAGIAITLQHLTESGKSLAGLKKILPEYHIVKKKIELGGVNPDDIINALKRKYSSGKINAEDGLRIDFPDHWIHLRKSNTEPIIRIITEAGNAAEAEKTAQAYVDEINGMLK